MQIVHYKPQTLTFFHCDLHAELTIVRYLFCIGRGSRGIINGPSLCKKDVDLFNEKGLIKPARYKDNIFKAKYQSKKNL